MLQLMATKAALYHDLDEGDVYVSQDEGKSWKRAEDLPKGQTVMVIEHPFDNRYVSLVLIFSSA